jgi:SAM-dependent methyltransferase
MMDSTDFGDRFPIAGDTHLQTAVLDALAEAVNYRRWLAGLATPWLGTDALEIGSGTGDYAAEWAQTAPKFTASEADRRRLNFLIDRFKDDHSVAVRHLSIPCEEHADFSAVVMFNVLEHIPDDGRTLADIQYLLRPGGRLIVLVPAFPFAMSRFDREIGHFRRYTVPSLRDVLTSAGYRVDEVRYINPVGLIAWTIGMKLLGGRPRAGLGLRLYDRIVPMLQGLERNRRPPFGQSVFAVATREMVAG